MKKDRATMSDEQRERQLIAEQIERAAAEQHTEAGPSTPPAVEEGLKRDENSEKVPNSPYTRSGTWRARRNSPGHPRVGTAPLQGAS